MSDIVKFSYIRDFIMECGISLFDFMKSNLFTASVFFLIAVFPRLIRLFKWSVGFK